VAEVLVAALGSGGAISDVFEKALGYVREYY
jgi:hypothetical protein